MKRCDPSGAMEESDSRVGAKAFAAGADGGRGAVFSWSKVGILRKLLRGHRDQCGRLRDDGRAGDLRRPTGDDLDRLALLVIREDVRGQLDDLLLPEHRAPAWHSLDENAGRDG